MQIGLRSIQNLKGERFHTDKMVFERAQNNLDFLSFPQQKDVIPASKIPLKPISDITNIAAIDVSSIRIGETEKGFLYAVRGAIVWKAEGQYRYLRLGPFLFYITDENKKEIHDLLKQHHHTASTQSNNPYITDMQTSIRNLLERWIQRNVCYSLQGSIILWDGSLATGTLEAPLGVVADLLKIARERFNTVLAFSKMTRLRLSGYILSDLTRGCRPPCLLEINDTATFRSICFLGKIYVAKLTKGSCSFRLDIDRSINHEQRMDAVQRLIGNDLILESYPETLRLAHIYSTFTANEVLGLQRFVVQKYGLKIIERPNIRRILFGPFGFEA